MSPELLDCAINASIDGLVKIDVYALSLIYWEALSRCSAQIGEVEAYTMPFEKELGPNINKENLRLHVSINKQRPKIPDHWCDHSDLKVLATTIKDCWDRDPEARLTARHIVRRLKLLKENIYEDD